MTREIKYLLLLDLNSCRAKTRPVMTDWRSFGTIRYKHYIVHSRRVIPAAASYAVRHGTDMPPLSRQFHRNDSADGYSIRDGYRNTHLHPDGVACLKKLGYKDEEIISLEHLKCLRYKGWLQATPDPTWHSNISAARNECEPKGLALFLHLAPEPAPWELRLSLPKITEKSELRSDVLLDASLRVGDREIGAILLWPGGDAVTVPVRPSEHRYDVRTIGNWPTNIDTSRWRRGAEGLDPLGAVFTLVQSEWRHVERDGDVFWDQDCLILRQAGDNHAPLPAAMEADPLEILGAWHLFQARFPSTPEIHVTEWCKRRNLSVYKQPWTLSLVTPPVCSTAKGIPVFRPGMDILIAAQQIAGSAQSAPLPAIFDNEVQVVVDSSSSKDANGPVYLRLIGNKSGDHCLRFEQRRSASLAFAIEPQADLLPMPQTLQVTIGEETIAGWCTDEIKATHPWPTDTLRILVQSPVPVSWIVQTTGLVTSGDNQACETAGDALSIALRTALQSRQSDTITMIVDAGVFGRIERLWHGMASGKSGERPPQVLSRLKWLSTLIGTGDGPTISHRDTSDLQVISGLGLARRNWGILSSKLGPHARNAIRKGKAGA